MSSSAGGSFVIRNWRARKCRVYFRHGQKNDDQDLAQLIEKGFAAVAGDIGEMKTDLADIKRNMATKEQVTALHTQVNSIEAQLRQRKPRGVSRISCETTSASTIAPSPPPKSSSSTS